MKNQTNPNVLGIYVWKIEDQDYYFRVRGIGNKYREFFEWRNTKSSIIDISNDWPWSYHKANSQVIKEISAKFGEDVIWENE